MSTQSTNKNPTGLFSMFLELLAFIKSVNLIAIFAPLLNIKSASTIESNDKVKTVKSKKIIQTKRKKASEPLFPKNTFIDKRLTDGSVVACSTSYNASFVPIKNEEGTINWDLTDIDLNAEFFSHDNGSNQSAMDERSNNMMVPEFMTNSTTCSTVSDTSPVAHNLQESANNLQTIPTYGLETSKPQEQDNFRDSVISNSDNDDASLNEIDFEQLTKLTVFEMNNSDSNIATGSGTKISTPELKQTSKSASNSPAKVESSPNMSHSSSSSISSSPEIGSDYAFNGNEDELEDLKGLNGTSKKTSGKSHTCPFCTAQFRIRGYLTRHIKKHAVQKAYTCPFFNLNAEHKCHPNGGFSRRDTYKTHLKARHFRYPQGTRSQDRSHVGGKCGVCGAGFETNENWVENHIENGSCPGLPVGYQCRSAGGRRKSKKMKSLDPSVVVAGAGAGSSYTLGVGISLPSSATSAYFEQQQQSPQQQHQHHQQQQQQLAQQQHLAQQRMMQMQNPNLFNSQQDLIQRSISPLDYQQQRVSQQQLIASGYVAQQPRNQVQQNMYDVNQSQDVAFQAAAQMQQMQQQMPQMAQPMQQQIQQPLVSEEDEFIALADEYSTFEKNESAASISGQGMEFNQQLTQQLMQQSQKNMQVAHQQFEYQMGGFPVYQQNY